LTTIEILKIFLKKEKNYEKDIITN